MYTRKNQRNLTRTEKRRLVDALLALKRSGRYDEFVRMHGDFYVTDAEEAPRAAHMTPSFFPWHRAFLLDFERALQKVDADVTIPYWDWTVDNSPASSLWADDFLGGTGRVGDRQVMTGPFAYGNGNWPINSRVTDGRYLTRNLGRPSDPVTLPTKQDVADALKESVYDEAPWDSTVSSGFRNRIEGWSTDGMDGMDAPVRWRNHNRVHRWVGGLMLGATSPNDPVFWLHHSFIDLLWHRWQKAHPDAEYLPRTPLPASDPQGGRVFARDEPLPPWGTTTADLLDHTRWYRYA
ncbi:tyrosinase family protein [Streptomyces sp. NBC_00690]|uniref:tyrosinase family protein n=1 Tax=Streptomyces sp. NBC_00690 TaxID=2975808 RepID=UPI002E2C6B46|nr:tyrosinase family protein [Streptomyces sp. NBC_00690]